MDKQIMSLMYHSSLQTEDGGISTADINLSLTGEDLEYLPNVMRKIEGFIRAIGFDYVRLEASKGDYSRWTYFEEAGDNPAH